MKLSRRRAEDCSVKWINTLPIELTAAKVLLDEKYENNNNTFQYILGRMGQHHIALAHLPAD